MKETIPVHISLKPSRLFFIMMVVIFLGGLISVFYSPLPYYTQFLLAIMTVSYGWHILWTDVLLRAKKAVISVTGSDDNTWRMKERSGEIYLAVLRGDSVMMGIFCILRFDVQQKIRTCVVFHDAVSAACYRQLLKIDF